MSWSAPFVGALSEKVPLWLAKSFGRRRPYIVGGRISSVIGNLLIYVGMIGLTKPNGFLLFVGLVIMNLGGCLASPAFNAIIPDTIPLDQRGLCITVMTWTGLACGLLGNVVGTSLGPWAAI